MIRITQLLCPNRHCILGIAYDDGETTFEKTQELINMQMEANHIDHKCLMCGSTEFHFEDGASQFKTMEEAYGPLMKIQLDNLVSRAAVLKARQGHRN